MEKISSDQIGFYGKPIDRLTREELLEAITLLASTIKECGFENKKCEKFAFVKKENQTDK